VPFPVCITQIPFGNGEKKRNRNYPGSGEKGDLNQEVVEREGGAWGSATLHTMRKRNTSEEGEKTMGAGLQKIAVRGFSPQLGFHWNEVSARGRI